MRHADSPSHSRPRSARQHRAASPASPSTRLRTGVLAAACECRDRAIARALAQRSRVVLADEPVSSLDPSAAAKILVALRTIARDEGIAVLCSLHQVAMVAGFADRVLGLRHGRLVLNVAGAQFDERHHEAVCDTGARG